MICGYALAKVEDLVVLLQTAHVFLCQGCGSQVSGPDYYVVMNKDVS
jgi:hypothetical protein